MTSIPPSQTRIASLVALGAGAIVFACSTPDRATSPTPGAERADLLPAGTVPTPGVVTLCKVGADGAFSVQVGTSGAWSTVQMGYNSCRNVAEVHPAPGDDVIVTITEQPRPTYALDHIVLQHGGTSAQTITSGSTVSFEAAHGAIVTYYNNAVVTVCKEGTAGTFEYQFGLGAATQSLALQNGQCREIGRVNGAPQDDVIVTVREQPSANYKLDHITLTQGLGTEKTITGQTQLGFEGVHGAVVTFHNVPSTPTSGCTYTQGYYKNKGASLLPTGTFYASGQTYLAVLNTPPKGNAYYILAHQFIAATLNAKSASVPANVQTALTQSGAYFATSGIAPATPYTTSFTKAGLTAWADLLARYNEGLVGPGHCNNE